MQCSHSFRQVLTLELPGWHQWPQRGTQVLQECARFGGEGFWEI